MPNQRHSDSLASDADEAAAAELATVTVTYHPDHRLLHAQLEALPRAALKVVIDNASPDQNLLALRAICEAIPNCLLVRNERNLGLPAAINQGMRLAQGNTPTIRYGLFLDQDTEPGADGVPCLLRWYKALAEQGANPGCVGPKLVDVQTSLEHGFHQVAGWRWVRRYTTATDAPVECANLNCSGTLLSMDLFTRLGGLDESFFVDHLDTEWSFRVIAAGYRLYGIPAVAFRHRMGQKTWRIWLGRWRVWPYRSPERHYLLFRNYVWLMRRQYVPAVWKFWAVLKLALTLLVHGLLDTRRFAQLRCMLGGLAAGCQRVGKVDNSSSFRL